MESKFLTRQRLDRELANFQQPDRRTLHEKLVLGCRILGAEAHWQGGLAGQITARGEKPGTYWTLQFGIGADEARPEHLLLVDDDLRTLDGQSLPNPAARFHLWVYRQRPDVQCIVHTHPPAVSALCTIGQPLIVANMDATPFFDNCSFLEEWPGLPIADSEGDIIAKALGARGALLLAHHGLLTVGKTVEEAIVLAVWLEQAAEAQLRATAAGTMRPVDHDLAAESRDFLLKPEITGLTFQYFARRALRQDPDCLVGSAGASINT